MVGPEGLGFINDIHDVELLAEVGGILLLFSIGSEFYLQRLLRLWRSILIGGFLQVGLTSAVVFMTPKPIRLFAVQKGFLGERR
ncbi:MAG: cation:proton antiporter [Candidatus Omnitrophica bacterium]|nr:cation:proton antiporter [Candidatus Omnitrophota bacterium]